MPESLPQKPPKSPISSLQRGSLVCPASPFFVTGHAESPPPATPRLCRRPRRASRPRSTSRPCHPARRRHESGDFVTSFKTSRVEAKSKEFYLGKRCRKTPSTRGISKLVTKSLDLRHSILFAHFRDRPSALWVHRFTSQMGPHLFTSADLRAISSFRLPSSQHLAPAPKYAPYTRTKTKEPTCMNTFADRHHLPYSDCLRWLK